MPYTRFRVVDKQPVGPNPPTTGEVEGWFGSKKNPEQLAKSQTAPSEVTMSSQGSSPISGTRVNAFVAKGSANIASRIVDQYTINNLPQPAGNEQLELTINEDGSHAVTANGNPIPGAQVSFTSHVQLP